MKIKTLFKKMAELLTPDNKFSWIKEEDIPKYHRICEECDGSGHEDALHSCQPCGGNGLIRQSYQEYVDSLSPLDEKKGDIK